MRQINLKGGCIRGIQCAVPKNIISNEYFKEKFSDDEILKSSKMTGVKERRWVNGSTCTSDLCEAASVRLLDELGWDKRMTVRTENSSAGAAKS